MRFIIIAVLACHVAVILANPRIFGGHDAPDGKYPYQVSIKVNDKHNCGGSIINKYWILTAAHCVKWEETNSLTVLAGTNLQSGGITQQVYKAKYAVGHKKFDIFFHTEDDIGLVRVDREIEFNDRVQPISLPKSEDIEVGTLAVLTGWGFDESNNTPQKLQELTLKIYDHEKCKSYWKTLPYIVGEKQICSLGRNPKSGACNGDSGGPLVIDGVQVGITSYANHCASGQPEVYTKVHAYLDWITKQINKYEKNHS